MIVSLNELIMLTELTAPFSRSEVYTDDPGVLGSDAEAWVNDALIRDIPARLPLFGGQRTGSLPTRVDTIHAAVTRRG
jgi:hypothetical protein